MKHDPTHLPELDGIDRRILTELQDDGRMTNVELARRADISAPPCLRRLRRLEESGVIRGYHADTDPAKLQTIRTSLNLAYMRVELSGSPPSIQTLTVMPGLDPLLSGGFSCSGARY